MLSRKPTENIEFGVVFHIASTGGYGVIDIHLVRIKQAFLIRVPPPTSFTNGRL